MRKTVDQICGEVYRARLDKCDRDRVTKAECQKRGQCYRPVILATLAAVNYTPKKDIDMKDLL